MARLVGKVALITGGSSGIGRATALAFAKEGAKVVVASRRTLEGEETAQLIKDIGGEAFFVKTDVAKAVEVEALVNKTVATYGRLDIAFNNAGIEGPIKTLVEQTEEEFDSIIDINLKGLWLSMKYEILEMLKLGGGTIVNTSSISGLVGMPASSIYSASKHGVLGMTKSAALEYAKSGIRINAVSPGSIETAMLNRFLSNNPFLGNSVESKEQMMAKHPLGRIGDPEEVAEAVVWLCSDGASFVTGQSLTVDGGYTIQ
ncbi:SDR family oxidoreductase [Microseira sp. BLCC-F43]|jgi:NAD(P)-dependent dehydrogenase (short-subunit alcohol dehydrogenase family)|uniref:SDR family oxidoreductase n=1 Tax=Microseira sp. BLCC-F43 TaxID=3153602 RepID=UPI0035BA475F